VRQVLDLEVDGGSHGLAEGHDLVERVDPEPAGVAVGGGVELAHQPIAVQHRQREVPPPALGRRLVHLELVVELPPALPVRAAVPGGHVGTVERQVRGGPDHRPELEQRQAGQRGLQVRGRIGRPEAAPRHQAGVGRDHRDRVDLEQGQAAHHVQQRDRARRVQELRAHGDAARIGTGELVTVTSPS
jgi:hypothetical protein